MNRIAPQIALLASAVVAFCQTSPEVHSALAAQLGAQGLPPNSQPPVPFTPSMVTPLPVSTSAVYAARAPALELAEGWLFVRFDGKPRRIYYIQARNLTSQSWATVSPQFPAPARTGYPFRTNATHKYYRIMEGDRTPTGLTFKTLATLTNR